MVNYRGFKAMNDVGCGQKLCDWGKPSYVLVHMITWKSKVALAAFVVNPMIHNLSYE